jgi:hypothetical protein
MEALIHYCVSLGVLKSTELATSTALDRRNKTLEYEHDFSECAEPESRCLPSIIVGDRF